METRQYPGTGEAVSLLGFGAMRLPIVGDDSAAIDRAAAKEMVDAAIAGGITYFDTAYVYHGGMSEVVLGEALAAHPRGAYTLATKLPPWRLTCEEDVTRLFEEQLRRCRVDYFDYYLLHNQNVRNLAVFEKYGAYEKMRELQKQGKIRKLGFSFHDRPALLKKIIDTYEWDFAQIQLNYLDWDAQDAKRQYELLAGKSIPVVVMEPVRGGSLAQLTPASAAVFTGADPTASLASWAIRYAASLPGVLTVLSGMSNIEQLRDNLATMNSFAPLSAAERATVERAVAVYRAAAAVPCTACRYCMDCEFGVDIPHVFTVYNQLQSSGSTDGFQMSYSGLLNAGSSAASCRQCGVCVAKCPQNIDIPAQMEKIDARYRQIV